MTACSLAERDPADLHVIVGMSGGVDSSVAALRLQQQGYQVSGIFMQNWEDDDEHCTARQDYRDASAVADRIGIPLSTVNFADEYWERVFSHFLEEYGAGRTPNPDILCNQEIKFRAFLDHAKSCGADAIATGHYVQTDCVAQSPTSDRLSDTSTVSGSVDRKTRLLRGLDPDKDQSYFLHTLNQEQVSNALFPIGGLDKPLVRELARDAGFHVHSKKDSTGICFIGERKFNTFLAEYLPAQPGQVINEAGDVLGQHNGLMFYTLGQRQGLGIGGLAAANGEPWYVLDKDLGTNSLLVGQGHNHPRLFRDRLRAQQVHWVAGIPPGRQFQCTAKVRYRQSDVAVSVTVLDDSSVQAEFSEPVRAITPGQSVVFYDHDVCLGGGIISDFVNNNPVDSLVPAATNASPV